MIRVNKEETECRFFTEFRKEAYPHVIHRYKNAWEFFPKNSFAECTGGDGDTDAFRQYLKEYIKTFEAQKLIEGKPYYLELDEDGEFVLLNADTGKTATNLTKTERLIYHYLCFVYTAKFWQNFEKMRDLNVNLKPLVIEDFVEHLDSSVNVMALLKKAKDLNRRIVLIM